MLFLAVVYVLAWIGAVCVVVTLGLVLGIGLRECRRARASCRMDREVAQTKTWLALRAGHPSMPPPF